MIAHFRIGPCDAMAHSDAQETSISGRLGTRRLGTIVFTISFVVCVMISFFIPSCLYYLSLSLSLSLSHV
jgi:uncharacterized membrane protein